MNVQLLVVKDCPNETPAATVLRQALDQVGLDAVRFTTQVVTGQQEAELLGFLGSPSILIDGKDPFAGDRSPGSRAGCTATTPAFPESHPSGRYAKLSGRQRTRPRSNRAGTSA